MPFLLGEAVPLTDSANIAGHIEGFGNAMYLIIGGVLAIAGACLLVTIAWRSFRKYAGF